MTFLEDTYRFRTDVSRGTGGVAPGGGGTATVSIANGVSYCTRLQQPFVPSPAER